MGGGTRLQQVLMAAAFSLATFSLVAFMSTLAPAADPVHRHRRLWAHGLVADLRPLRAGAADAPRGAVSAEALGGGDAAPGAGSMGGQSDGDVPQDLGHAGEQGSGDAAPGLDSAGQQGAQQPAPQAAAQLAAAAVPSCGASLFAETELGGDVVVWGANNLAETAAECCAKCAQAPTCSVFVFCSSAQACGELHGQCWLKRLVDAWDEAEMLQGKSSRWTSGILGARPAPSASRGAEGTPPEVALVTEAGEVRIRLFAAAAPLAAAFVRKVARVAPSCTGCRFYRAEPVPSGWGSKELPDSWSGGRWGPPYALMQGSFMPSRTDEPGVALPAKPPAESGQRARPLIRRGMLAWAGGGGGGDAFIALAEHPEWGHGHTVWGEVVAEDMAIVDRLMQRPLRSEDWGAITASLFVAPLTFQLRLL
ncbi:hypothetical protein T492DRAFT_837221 [Pavlovales sp. CCMP2436]|nr:hypothetical protein T492DRAFT_837221 [Pavlovales sp. CCMP2436]